MAYGYIAQQEKSVRSRIRKVPGLGRIGETLKEEGLPGKERHE